MRLPGQIALCSFPRSDFGAGKFRPVLVVARLPGPFSDWLVCMISTQLRQAVEGFDEIIHDTDADFPASGLKATSLIRVARLAVVRGRLLSGSLGEVARERLLRIRNNIVRWLSEGVKE
jgi:mRNA interferase MazF